MAILLDTLTRAWPAPCTHFVAVVSVDGTPRATVTITAAELQAPITDDDVETLMRLWVRYHRAKGDTLASLVGKAIFPETV